MCRRGAKRVADEKSDRKRKKRSDERTEAGKRG